VTLRHDLDLAVRALLDGGPEIERLMEPPARTALPLGRTVARIEAVSLAVDVRQHSAITVAFGPDVALQLIKAFFHGAISLVQRQAGTVVDFNGDGMIVLFSGGDGIRRGFRVGAEIRWLVNQVLEPAFRPYFADPVRSGGCVERFDVGCGLAEGVVSIGRVGTAFASDLACVGEGVHAAGRLCKLARSPRGLAVTDVVCHGVDGYPPTPVDWVPADAVNVGGVVRQVFTTAYEWPGDL
jgi:adenylate cyclase